MGNRTISNLSRELKVSRPTIYKKMTELGIEKGDAIFNVADYEKLKKALSEISAINKSIKSQPVITTDGEFVSAARLPDGITSTLRDRLTNAKQEYDYNRDLIVKFQTEADEYFKKHGKTTTKNHTGTESTIQAITSLEKYVKLNIALSKLISDIESDLDLLDNEGDNPFG